MDTLSLHRSSPRSSQSLGVSVLPKMDEMSLYLVEGMEIFFNPK